MFEAVAFYLFSAVTIAMFAITVMSSNALYAMSALAAGMIMISGFFFLLGADFLGVVQIIVYTGAVMAIYAFGMMFFNTTRMVHENVRAPKLVFLLSGMSALILVIALAAPIASDHIQALYPVVEGVENPQAVGIVLFTKYLVPFELAAVMLLVAMIAGIILAGKKMDESLTLKVDGEEEFQNKGSK
ncbi:NADH-ubiquinone oxidoreductase chain J [Hydrogenimonas sp.]|nr:NADH-ubiquinone oxidoreductase chain J [Hydrogenimonas sp.]